MRKPQGSERRGWESSGTEEKRMRKQHEEVKRDEKAAREKRGMRKTERRE